MDRNLKLELRRKSSGENYRNEKMEKLERSTDE
jgi:hypothetical protein